ncbi:MAG: hypothetical protein SA339_07790 [Methanomassiliicoccus sp.]|nr:hypothetical protein [Methanomassiliicoccus sp.]
MAVLSISFAGTFIRWSTVPAGVIDAYSMLFAALILRPEERSQKELRWLEKSSGGQ